MAYILVAAVVFGLCFLLDRGFTKVFRGQTQHKSGLAVKVSKRYATIGIFLIVLGIAAMFIQVQGSDLPLLIGGIFVVVAGICLIVYYLAFGVYYDDDGFVVSKFGKKSKLYRFSAIRHQQLYATANATVIELYFDDGNTLMLHSTMDGAYAFLDHAFARWCAQKGIDPDACDFHDPKNSLWFPNREED